jgi:hypothetical protein
MTNPDWNSQVKIGSGQAMLASPGTGAHHRPIDVARLILAICGFARPPEYDFRYPQRL